MSTPLATDVAAEQPRLEIRRLAYPDLPQVIGIERRAFPTPWSLAMFVLELSKPSGVCLAAVLKAGGSRRLAGYMICSRYETVWHVMNVAVAPEHRREGVASALLGELYVRVDDEQARYTLEVRRSNDTAIHLYEREGFRAAGMRTALLPGQRRGRARDVAHPRNAGGLPRGRAQPRLLYDQPRRIGDEDPRAGDQLRRHLRGAHR